MMGSLTVWAVTVEVFTRGATAYMVMSLTIVSFVETSVASTRTSYCPAVLGTKLICDDLCDLFAMVVHSSEDESL